MILQHSPIAACSTFSSPCRPKFPTPSLAMKVNSPTALFLSTAPSSMTASSRWAKRTTATARLYGSVRRFATISS